jgi:acetyl-CoA carboxylase alpha subunit
MIAAVGKAIEAQLKKLQSKSAAELKAYRRQRFLDIGRKGL